MQQDVDVSPTASIISLILALTHMTFDLDINDPWRWPQWHIMTFYLVWIFVKP